MQYCAAQLMYGLAGDLGTKAMGAASLTATDLLRFVSPAIQQYVGHKNIQHTVRYTELAAGRFKVFWKD